MPYFWEALAGLPFAVWQTSARVAAVLTKVSLSLHVAVCVPSSFPQCFFPKFIYHSSTNVVNYNDLQGKESFSSEMKIIFLLSCGWDF